MIDILHLLFLLIVKEKPAILPFINTLDTLDEIKSIEQEEILNKSVYFMKSYIKPRR